MIKIVSVIIAFVFVFSFAGMTFSAEKQNMKVFAGAVKKIDTKEKTITLWNDKVPEFTCSVDENNITKSGSGKKTLADIKIGDIVVVAYGEVNGKNVAKAVTISSPAAASPGEKAKPAVSEGKK